eukprot:9430056-Alexandrium_andersonii.AAC.1
MTTWACLPRAVERASAGDAPARALRLRTAGPADTGRLPRAARLGVAFLTRGMAPGSTTSDADRLGGSCAGLARAPSCWGVGPRPQGPTGQQAQGRLARLWRLARACAGAL